MQSSSLRRLISLLSAGALVATLMVATSPAAAFAAAPPAPYFNGFENSGDATPWVEGATDTQPMFDVTSVASGAGSVNSADGAWHAQANTASSAFTRYGGYSSTFPVGGYTTSADIYLDMALATGGDLRFDWSSAISSTSVAPTTHRRDFIFNVGTNPTAAGQFIVSASNNAPGNPAGGLDPLTVSTSGWYTFQHRFYDAGAGVLAVDLSVRAIGSATPLKTWILSDPTDLIGTTVGGNRYGWLVNNAMPLALDNVTRSGNVLPSCAATGFVRDGINLTAAQIGGAVTGTLDATGCNIGAYNPTSVTGATIFGANYFGVVANGVALDLTNSTIRNIGEVPFNGAQHGNAVVYINGATGTISGNTVFDYQKNGITVSGKDADGVLLSSAKTSALVSNNLVTGEGPVTYIAQNGIQISYGASATVTGNTVSDNYYTPTSNTACGLLFFQAGGVKQSGNNLFNNEVNFCNAGRGGGKPRP